MGSEMCIRDSYLSVCLLATLHNNFQTDLHEIFRDGSQGANEQMIKFWWRSRSRIRIMTLVRCALAEVCIVPILLVGTEIPLTNSTTDYICLSDSWTWASWLLHLILRGDWWKIFFMGGCYCCGKSLTSFFLHLYLQCFDTVACVAGRASSL